MTGGGDSLPKKNPFKIPEAPIPPPSRRLKPAPERGSYTSGFRPQFRVSGARRRVAIKTNPNM